uniref:MTOR-associated protein MEAK7 n=1 Tax=Steinernema glaseri TaxID=37863 RepID=A0A1I7YRQ6_9BILA
MGAAKSKSNSRKQSQNFSNLSAEQMGKAKLQFRRASQGADVLMQAQFNAFVEPFLTEAMRDSVFNKMSQPHNKVVESVFVQFADKIMGDTSELAGCLLSVHGTVDRFITDICGSLFLCENKKNATDVDQLVAYLRRSAPKANSEEALYQWLHASPFLVQLTERVYTRLLLAHESCLAPTFVGGQSSILSSAEVLLLNFNVPREYRHKWELLFSSTQHGASFSKMCSLVNCQGPSLLCIESEDGRVFGGYANAGFIMGPGYTGDTGCFLFQGGPAMDIFSATGFNGNYAYLNHNQHSLPNGIGIGGHDTYWSVFIREKDNVGLSGANVSTFEKCHLAGKNQFEPKKIEIWRTGNKPEVRKYDENGVEIPQKSVIDQDPGAKALLELTGRQLHSEAFREPHPEDD